MIIKAKKKKDSFNFNFFFKAYFITSIILISILLLIFFNTGPWVNSKKEFLNRIYFNGLNNYSKILEISLKGLKGLFNNYEEININLPYESIMLLEKDRAKLIKNSIQGFRSQSHVFTESSGSVNYNGEDIPIKIRLKGDRDTHYKQKEKSSYKVEIKGDERLMGMRKFSFMKPRARNYIHEWLFHEFSSEGGLIKLKYNFINLKINGESLGLYVLEESFDKDLIERSGRRNGPIFSLEEEFNIDIFSGKFELFNKNYWNKKENIKLSNYARSRLESFLSGQLNLNEVFDLDKWAWFFSVADLTYTHHGLDPRNVKFYYNPLNGLFEPIPYDGHRFSKNYNKNLLNFDHRNSFEMSSLCKNNDCKNDHVEKWLYKFFYKKNGGLNSEFYLKYISSTENITNKNFLNNFFNQNKEKINRINSGIYSDYFLIDNVTYLKYGPGLYYFSQEDIFYRSNVLQEKIQKKLNKISAIETEKKIILNNNYEPNNISLKISNLICEKRENQNTLKKNIKIEDKNKYFQSFELSRDKFDLKNLRCQFVEFTDQFNKKTYLKKIDIKIKKDLILKKDKKKYLNYFENIENNLYLKSSKIVIDRDIYIPKNYVVKIKPGQSIILKNNAFIISDSRWLVGGKEKKTFITGLKDNFGGGLVIKNDSEASSFINTEFKFFSGVENRFLHDFNFQKTDLVLTSYNENKKNSYLYKKTNFQSENFNFSDDFAFTGSINFYNTKVDLKDCFFVKIDSEDALNIVSSNFDINTVWFEENSSDSIDIDFGKGEIKNGTFMYIGNDALDFSGSEVKVSKLFLSNVGDKLISVGEKSNLFIYDILANNSYIGIASKDGSKSLVSKIDFNKVKIPFASYRKKESYKHGFLKIEKPIKINDYISITAKDKNSKILINEDEINKFNKNIIQIVYKKKIDLLR